MTDEIKTAYVGSRLNPLHEQVRQLALRLQDACKAMCSSRPLDLADAHNAMALYTLEMLKAASSHRAVTEPFSEIDCIDENLGIAILEDKVTGKGHEGRLVWLPKTAIAQLQHYLDHLRVLALYLQRSNPELSARIWAITEPGYPRLIPLFFYLEKKEGNWSWITLPTTALSDSQGSDWPLPDNVNRHLLATWLRANGCPAEFVDAQLGHVEIGCQPFGAYSCLSPSDGADLMRPLLETYLAHFGWAPVKGLAAPRGAIGKKPPPRSRYLNGSATFGARKRADIRAAKWIQDAEAVSKLWADQFPDGEPAAIDDMTVDLLRQKLIDQATAGAGRLLVRLALFRRLILRIRRKGTSIKLPGRLAISNPEPAPFTHKTIQDAKKFEAARQDFIGYLAAQEGKKLELERRLAEILLSSSLFGAHLDPRFLNHALLALLSRVYAIEDYVFTDVSLYPESLNSPARRWFLDPLTCALLTGLHQEFRQAQGEFDHAKLLAFATEILESIGFPEKPARNRQKPSVSVTAVLGPFLTCGKAYWRLRLPGVLRAYAEGEHICASLPLDHWLRLATGQTPKSAELPSEDRSFKPVDDLFINSTFDAAAANWTLAKTFWKRLTKEIGANDPSGAKRSTLSKQALEARLTTLAKNESPSLPPIANCLVHWLIHLCRHGTQHQENLRTSTIVSYARTIGLILIEQAYDQDFLKLPAIGIEDIYRRALEQTSRSNKDYVVQRFKEFHRYLVAALGVPVLDWSEVVDEDSAESNAVDAGAVALSDYLAALDMLLADARHEERLRQAHGMVLFLAYRFGLRAGEIFRLTVADIQVFQEDVVIYVRNSVYGETKSENGVRQIPLVGPITELERTLLARWLAHVGTYADQDHLAALLSIKSDSRIILDRTACITNVVEALHKATNGLDTRLRHLRHTFATKLFLGMLLPDRASGQAQDCFKKLWGNTKPSAVRETLLERPEITRRAMYALAVAVGHGNPGVALNHYIHLADIALANVVNNQIINVQGKALAYIYQTSYANIRKIRSRASLDSNIEKDPLLRMHFQSKLIMTPIEIAADPIAEEIPPAKPPKWDADLADIDRILSLAGMRGTAEGLADRFFLTDEQLSLILEIAAELQAQTGLTDFGLDQSSFDNWEVANCERHPKLEKEAKRTRRFLSQLHSGQLANPLMQALKEVWSDSYFPHATELLVRSRTDLKRLMQALQHIGIPAKDFELVIPDAMYGSNQSSKDSVPRPNSSPALSELEQLAREMGLATRVNPRLPSRRDKLQPSNRVGLILRASRAHGLGYQQTLNRVLFILSCYHVLTQRD